MNGRGAEREGDTESETGSRLRAISPEPDAGLELPDREIVTWLKLNRLCHPGAPVLTLKSNQETFHCTWPFPTSTFLDASATFSPDKTPAPSCVLPERVLSLCFLRWYLGPGGTLL